MVVDEEKAFGQDVSTSVEEGHLVHPFSQTVGWNIG